MIHGAVFTKAVFISHDRHFMLFHQLVGQQGNHSLGSAQIKDFCYPDTYFHVIYHPYRGFLLLRDKS